MLRHTHLRHPLLWLIALVLAPLTALGGSAEDAKRAELAAKGKFKIDAVKDNLVVDIATKGDAAVGEWFEVRRGDRLIGYAKVAELVGYWPKLEFILGTGAKGDELTRVSPPMPGVQLLTDDPDCREAKELKALCGDKLRVVRISERMRAPFPDEALVVLYHAGAPFMMGDPIVAPHAAKGGLAIVDMMAYCHLRGIPADETLFEAPPSLRFIDIGTLTPGLSEEARVPWYGTKTVLVTPKPKPEPKSKRGSRSRRKPKRKPRPPRPRKQLRYVTRIAPGTPAREGAKRIATDESTNNTTMVFEPFGGEDSRAGILALDLISLTGKAGIDPGAKNKWVFAARALGTGPRYSIFRPAKPSFDDLTEELNALVENSNGRATRTMEGGASGDDNLVHSFTIGPKSKPLVLVVGCLDGTDWISAVSAVRLAEVLLANDAGDYKIDWLLKRLRVKFIPCLNIPGYKANTPANANKVTIDRNFDYHWNEFEDKAARGTEPFSEPEADMLRRIVADDKPIALLELAVDDYDGGYRMVRARDADRPQRDLSRVVRDILNARLRHRYVLGDKPLLVRLLKGAQRPSLANWAGAKGVFAATLKLCGDGEDSLVNTDVAVEGGLAFLQALALSRQKPPPPPAPPKQPASKRPRRTKRPARRPAK